MIILYRFWFLELTTKLKEAILFLFLCKEIIGKLLLYFLFIEKTNIYIYKHNKYFFISDECYLCKKLWYFKILVYLWVCFKIFYYGKCFVVQEVIPYHNKIQMYLSTTKHRHLLIKFDNNSFLKYSCKRKCPLWDVYLI